MKKHLLLLIMVFLSLTLCNAQEIEFKRDFWGYKFSQNEEKLSVTELENILKKNTSSLALFKKGKSNILVASILNFSGGFLIGIPIGQSITGEKANWTLAGIGAGIAIIGFPIYSSAHKKIKQSIELHNSNQTSTTLYELKLNATSNGISVSFKF